MRELSIAYGNSCFAKTWANKTITWEELCGRLSTTLRTTESQEEYPKMKKADHDKAKDKGGFVGGQLKNNRRKIENVVSRSMLTLDVDQAEEDFISKFASECKVASCLYTTHGHRPESPRCRIIVPLSRDITPDEYAAITRFFAADWGIDQFDECSYKPNQLMYWPTTPANGEFICRVTEGEWFDPDLYLKLHPQWKDCSLLPTSSRERAVREKEKKHQENPLEKKGIVGAFCRTYGIGAAISAFLSDIYEPSAMVGRYDYIPADSSAGVVVYDDKFAYSHHATDPACGMELNAFDLVRIHRFGNDDEKKSFKEMTDFAITDDAVKAQLAKERMEQAGEDFADADWQKHLTLDKTGGIKDSLDNLVLILKYDEGLQNIAFNCHRDGIDARGGLPWEQIKDGWNDSDNAALKVYLSKHYNLYSPTKTKDAVLAVAAERAYHPIKEYLDSLPDWDGIPRVDTLYIDYFGAEDNSYTRAVCRKSMVAAVARIYHPGTKFDSVPILNGPQGIGKSTFFAKLAGEWFSDSLTLTDMKDKSGPEKLQGYWILELGELAGMKKADVETVKTFISRVDDKYRASYGVSVESHPRQCVIVGSTNAETGFLRDITGNRRFWPVRVDGIKNGLERDGILNGAGHEKWCDTNIRQILTNEKYIGDAILQKTVTTNILKHKREPNDGTKAPRYYVSENHEPIISREVFTAARAEMQRRSRLTNPDGKRRNYNARNALGGVLVCASCGDPFRRHVWNAHGKKNVVWRCRNRVLNGPDSCQARTIKEDDLKEAVIRAINETYGDREELLPELTEALEKALLGGNKAEIDGLTKQMKKLQKKIVSLTDEAEQEQVGEEIRNIKNRVNELRSSDDDYDEEQKRLEEMIAFLKTEGTVIREYDDSLVRKFIDCIMVYDYSITIRFKTGTELSMRV